jgi:hypothetical protein
MLYPITGYVTGVPGTLSLEGPQAKHIIYVGTDGHLRDLVATLNIGPQTQIGLWQYNVDITAAANATIEATNAIQRDYFTTPVPNALGNVGAVTAITGSLRASAFYGGLANLLAYMSVAQPAAPRVHVVLTNGTGQIVDLWSDGQGIWHWGLPLQKAQYVPPPTGSGDVTVIGGPVNLATGLAAFVVPGEADSIVYVGGDAFIWELVLPQGSSELPSGGPGYVPSIGLPWTAKNASVMAGAPQSPNPNPKYVPPLMA